jgi:hypothetical protein
MKRASLYALCVVSMAALVVLGQHYKTAQPRMISFTRGEAVRIAEAQARAVGIPVDEAWTNITWSESPILTRALETTPERRSRASRDPVLSPRLGSYKVTYYRRQTEKWTPYGFVSIGGHAEILEARRFSLPETAGAHASEETLRPRADAFVRTRTFAGAPSPQFESARPSVLRNRTDWVFRYRVRSAMPIGNIVPYLYVHFTGDTFSGWELAEEYADGSGFRGDTTGDIASTFLRFAVMYAMLLVLLLIFLRKYHAGEAGVGTATLLFAAFLALKLAFSLLVARSSMENLGLGSLTAQQTAWAQMGFKFMFVDLPMAVLLFFGWSVGESYARERWGQRLASFDAILRRDPFNATVGRSLLDGLLAAPVVAAAAFAAGMLPLALKLAHPVLGIGSAYVLFFGGPLTIPLAAASNALVYSVIVILFVLAATSRRRALAAGVALATVLGAIGGAFPLPIEPYSMQTLFGFGGILACIVLFLASDLLTTAIAMFVGTMIVYLLPLLGSASGELWFQLGAVIALPAGAILLFGVAALLTGREVVYTYEDLAPHVKRIVERERVKAEIDAANRIQAALLPLDTPSLPGASVASHYRAATEIGGDYFDFLPQPGGEIGIAFGDVSGHGLTSGIVMAMAKSALLVQVDADSSPAVVLSVLNEIVIRTSPKRTLMTFFFGLLDPFSQTLRFSSAGHLDPYVFRAATGAIEPLSSWGFPLGVRRREPFQELIAEFDAGDRLILYSDGLIEAVDDDGEPFGFERFEQTLVECGHMKAEDIKKALLASIRKFTRNRPPEDDQTLVVISFEEAAAERFRPEARTAAASAEETIN